MRGHEAVFVSARQILELAVLRTDPTELRSERSLLCHPVLDGDLVEEVGSS